MGRIGKEVSKVFKSIQRDIDKATVYALNESAKSALVHTIDKLRETYNVKKAGINKLVKIRKATFKKQEVVLSFQDKFMGLQYFSARQTKKGITYGVKHGKRDLLESAFFVRKDSNTKKKVLRGVFKRKGKERLPIKKIYTGVNPGKVLTTDQSLDRMTIDFFKIYEERFYSKLEYFLNKK
ncbi:MAG: hypothetical protein V3V16_14280 [Melioribacteraceae bacterium]